MNNYIIESFLLGLSVGPICLVHCLPILAPLLTSLNTPNISTSTLTLLQFLIGRFSGYLLIGIVAGIVGDNIQQYAKGNIFGIISIVLGLFLVYFSIQKNFPKMNFCKFIRKFNSQMLFLVLLGFLTGLNLCPPFLAAILGATETGSIAGSVIYFSAFFVGTTVFSPVMVFLGLFSKIDSARTIANICMMISGGWFFMKGLILILSF